MFRNIGHCWALPRPIPYVKLGLKSINHIFKNWRRIYRWEKCDCAPFSSLGNNVNQRKLRWDEWSMRVYEHLNGRQFKLWILWPFGKTGCTRIKDDVHVLIQVAYLTSLQPRTWKLRRGPTRLQAPWVLHGLAVSSTLIHPFFCRGEPLLKKWLSANFHPTQPTFPFSCPVPIHFQRDIFLINGRSREGRWNVLPVRQLLIQSWSNHTKLFHEVWPLQ